MRILGRKLGIFIDKGDEKKIIGLSTSASININTDMVEKAALGSKAKAFLPGRYGFTLQCDRLYDASSDDTDFNMQRFLLLSQLRGDMLDFVMSEAVVVSGELTIDNNSPMVISGKAYVSGFTANAAVDGYASVNISFQGTEELTVEY